MLKTMQQDFLKFAKNNPLYLVSSVIYYLLASATLGGHWISFIVAAVFYAISLAVVFSPLGRKATAIGGASATT